MLHNDLICDFNLYLCEKFGYRNSCSVMQNANGFCVNIRKHSKKCTFYTLRFGCSFAAVNTIKPQLL